MILNEEIIEIIFRFLNFGVLVTALYYLYVNYIAPAAQSDIEADQKKVAILAQQKDAYHQQEQFIVKQIQDQEESVTHLMQKFEEWESAAQDVQRAEREEHVRLQDALRKKAAEQSEHIAQYMLERRSLPHAIEELEVSLTDYFKPDKRGSAYVASVVDHIDKDR
jgi:paraquat-inducible protein B